MPHEIERQYLVASESWRAHTSSTTEVTQGYLSIDPDRTVRVRIRHGYPAKLTIKGRNNGPVRTEFEFEIPVNEARQLLGLCIQPLIHKTRHLVEHRGFTWEIDVFDGANQGLVLAEVELEDASISPPLPDWIGRDVTNDPRFYNSNLVISPYTEWEAES
jgi:adenylate cyclase